MKDCLPASSAIRICFTSSFSWIRTHVYFCNRLWNKADIFKNAITSNLFYWKDCPWKGNSHGRGVAMAGQSPAQRGRPSVWCHPHQQYVAAHSSSLLPQVSSPGLLGVFPQLSLAIDSSDSISSAPFRMYPALFPKWVTLALCPDHVLPLSFFSISVMLGLYHYYVSDHMFSCIMTLVLSFLLYHELF